MRRKACSSVILLVTGFLTFLVNSPISVKAQCNDEENELAFHQRHPDDGTYIGQFTDFSNNFAAISLPLFQSDSPFRQAVDAGVKVDPMSDERIAHLSTEAYHGSVLAYRAWTVSVYVTDENTPRHDVALTACWSPYGRMLNVPIPDGALPDPVGDGHMAILAIDEGYEYDFWQIEQREDGRWAAAWGNRIPLDSSGVYPAGGGARGSGFALLAGMIWPDELDRGRIDHALIVAIPAPATGGPVFPATESDGYSEHLLALPEGTRLQLDPSLDLDTLDLTPWERTIAEALQRYGAYVGDVGGEDLGFYAVNANSWSTFPYSNHFGEPDFDTVGTGAILMEGIRLDYLRVLECVWKCHNRARRRVIIKDMVA